MRFGRRYQLTIQTNDGNDVIITQPITLQFNVERSTLGTMNSAQFQIYNLAPKTRDRIFQDRFNPKEYKRIILQAGYENLSTIFRGNIWQAKSVRQGPDIITYIEARDGAFDANGTITNKTVGPGQSAADIVKELAADFQNVKPGNLAGAQGAYQRPVVLNGNTFQLIQKYAGGQVFIDLEELQVLQPNQVVEGVLPLINSDTGLLETPQREDAYLRIETIFRPEIVVGQLLQIQSSVNPRYDGQYKVIGLRHNGTISEAISGDARSTFDLLVGSQLFGGFNKV